MRENLINGVFLIVRNVKHQNLISHTSDGKIIIPTNPVNPGYAIMNSFNERDNCILAVMTNVIKDYYYGIRYNEFTKVLNMYNYTVAGTLQFESLMGTEDMIVAFNEHYNTVIIAQTTMNKNLFQSIHVYCPNLDASNIVWNILESGDSKMSVMNLCKEKGSQELIISKIHKHMEVVKNTVGVDWSPSCHLPLSNYMDESPLDAFIEESRLKLIENPELYKILSSDPRYMQLTSVNINRLLSASANYSMNGY